MNDLALVGLKDEVQRLVGEVEWEYFVKIREPTVQELLLEFLPTVIFYKINQIDYDREDTLVFRLGGIIHSMLILDFGVKYGFYDKDFLEMERYQTSIFQFHKNVLLPAEFWRTLMPHSSKGYKLREFKRTKVKEPALCYLYRFITYSLDGWGDSNRVVSPQDLFYLWCLKLGQHCNLGCCFAYYFEKMVTKKKEHYMEAMEDPI